MKKTQKLPAPATAKKKPTTTAPAKTSARARAGFSWPASLWCEGGPVIVMGLSDYSHWTGAVHPLEPKPTTIHFWGQFTDELPKKFQPNGPNGHQYLTASTHEEARKLVDELSAFIKKKWPRSKKELDEHEPSGSLSGGYSIPGGRSMFLTLVNPSEYSLACDALDRYGVAVHGWGGRATGTKGEHPRSALVWDLEGSGLAQIGLNAKKDELVLFRQWIDEDEHELLVKEAVTRGAKEQRRGRIALDTDAEGHIVAAWSAPPRSAVTRASTEAALRKIATKRDPGFDAAHHESVGAVLELARGSYDVRVGTAEGEGWSCRWCRLVREATPTRRRGPGPRGSS